VQKFSSRNCFGYRIASEKIYWNSVRIMSKHDRIRRLQSRSLKALKNQELAKASTVLRHACACSECSFDGPDRGVAMLKSKAAFGPRR